DRGRGDDDRSAASRQGGAVQRDEQAPDPVCDVGGRGLDEAVQPVGEHPGEGRGHGRGDQVRFRGARPGALGAAAGAQGTVQDLGGTLRALGGCLDVSNGGTAKGPGSSSGSATARPPSAGARPLDRCPARPRGPQGYLPSTGPTYVAGCVAPSW